MATRHCLALLVAIGAAFAFFGAARSEQPLTRIQEACLAWDLHLQRMLGWSELLGIHPRELQIVVRQEASKLRERCTRDVTPATINRYVLLGKLLDDDEGDEVESFD
ncbi:MAG TPA: hypothetical protein VGN82_05785 [Bosea sp. (in: a-proteobacteria)]|jgi:hypothetical protein|uniref:hypothetical protein n=1 Tax=Bosea sp. (in: a-proteobacteria) TaxID=1871050 RepID=UPI002E13F374|nr:hypothetical protein [Bosea sp. (in: a-proteobacteria)]